MVLGNSIADWSLNSMFDIVIDCYSFEHIMQVNIWFGVFWWFFWTIENSKLMLRFWCWNFVKQFGDRRLHFLIGHYTGLLFSKKSFFALPIISWSFLIMMIFYTSCFTFRLDLHVNRPGSKTTGAGVGTWVFGCWSYTNLKVLVNVSTVLVQRKHTS